MPRAGELLEVGVGRPGRLAAPSTTPLSLFLIMMLVLASPPLSSMPRQLNILTIMVLIRAHCSFCLHTKALSIFLIIIVKHHVSRANYTLQSSQLWSTVLHHVTLRLITKTNQSTKCRIPRAFDANGMVTRFKNYWFRISWRRGVVRTYTK